MTKKKSKKLNVNQIENPPSIPFSVNWAAMKKMEKQESS
jgi:hypothetical protein